MSSFASLFNSEIFVHTDPVPHSKQGLEAYLYGHSLGCLQQPGNAFKPVSCCDKWSPHPLLVWPQQAETTLSHQSAIT